MIITRSPLRISLGGGGTDLRSYYSRFGGFLIAGAIDKYVYITVHESFREELLLKYSELECVQSVSQVKHPLFKASLELLAFEKPNLEIDSIADVPAGTGLGSSGAFTTCLLKALYAYKKEMIDPAELARTACYVEIDILKEPVGKQDQYISAFGGITCLEFLPDERVLAYPAQISARTLYNLEDNLVMFFTGYTRSAAKILGEQERKSKEMDEEMINNLHYVKKLGYEIKGALEGGDLTTFGKLMHEHWQYKKQRSAQISNSRIDELYDLAMRNGALGGKLIGAGGGGFLLFYTEEKRRLREVMSQAGLREVRFRFEFEGTKTIV